MYLKNLQVVLQVKSPSYSWCFVFVFPLQPLVTESRIGPSPYNRVQYKHVKIFHDFRFL